MRSIFIGFDPREADAFGVCRDGLRKHLTQKIPINGLVLSDLQERGLYTRPTRSVVNGDGRFQMIDEISVTPDYDGRMSTEFAVTRFLIGHIAQTGYAMFMDCDMLPRGNVARCFEICERDRTKAIWCVKHDHRPKDAVKMDGVPQTNYARKNWSSVMVWNVDHPKNKSLTLETINSVPGRDLHRFCWLEDDDIGELDPEWNWLVGHSSLKVDPAIVHFTEGLPDVIGHQDDPFAEEWRQYARQHESYRWLQPQAPTTEKYVSGKKVLAELQELGLVR